MPRLAARASIGEPPSSSSLAPPCVRPRSGSSSRRTSLPVARCLGSIPHGEGHRPSTPRASPSEMSLQTGTRTLRRCGTMAVSLASETPEATRLFRDAHAVGGIDTAGSLILEALGSSGPVSTSRTRVARA